MAALLYQPVVDPCEPLVRPVTECKSFASLQGALSNLDILPEVAPVVERLPLGVGLLNRRRRTLAANDVAEQHPVWASEVARRQHRRKPTNSV